MVCVKSVMLKYDQNTFIFLGGIGQQFFLFKMKSELLNSCKWCKYSLFYNMDNNFGFFNAKLYCEGALILVCVFVEL